MRSITNFLEISEHLGTGGQPEPDQFAMIKEAGYELMINLVPPSSPEWLSDEDVLAAEAGIAYLHIPVIWSQPTWHDLNLFFTALEQNQGRKIFVHCVMNFRVSVFVFLYRVIIKREPSESASRAMLQIWEPNETWQSFIEQCLRDD